MTTDSLTDAKSNMHEMQHICFDTFITYYYLISIDNLIIISYLV